MVTFTIRNIFFILNIRSYFYLLFWDRQTSGHFYKISKILNVVYSHGDLFSLTLVMFRTMPKGLLQGMVI